MKPYCKVTNVQYMLDGIQAARINAARKAKRNPDIVYKTKQTEHTSNAVKGTTAFAVLRNFDFEAHSYSDSFHAIMNIMKHILEILCGERAKNSGDSSGIPPTTTTDGSSSSSSSSSSKKPSPTSNNNNLWFLSEETRNKINTWINCLVVPAGYSRDFQVKHLFGDNAKMRGTALIDVLTNLLDYVLSADTDFSEDYRLFFHLFSLCISDLVNNKICKQDYEILCGRIIELLCYFENMLPPSEVITCFHQLIHIVFYIRQAGPTRHFSTLGNERALGILKRFMPNGGANMEFTVFKRYLDYEATCMDDAYDFKFTEEGIFKSSIISKVNYSIKQWCINGDDGNMMTDALCFTDEMFEMLSPIETNMTTQLTSEETSELFDAIRCSIELRTIDVKDALQKSFTYRILACYQHRYHQNDDILPNILRLNLKNMDFQTWLDYIISHLDDYFQMGVYIIKDKNPSIDQEIIEEIETNHGIYKNDAHNIMLLRDTKWTFTSFNSALIFGTKFRTRGFEKRESTIKSKTIRYGVEGKKKEEIIVNVPNNNYNKLPNNWYVTDDNSCWCKYRAYVNDEEVYRYGQINSFLQISMPFDPFVDGTCIASITSRKTLRKGYVDYVIADNEDGSLSDTLFIPAISIYSSPIIIGGFSSEWALSNQNGVQSRDSRLTQMLNDGKPIYIGGNMKEDIKHKHLVANPRATSGIHSYRNDLSYLVLIEMKRERKNIKYDLERDAEYLFDFSKDIVSDLKLNYSFKFK